MARPSKEYTAFVKLTDRLLAVPRAEIQKRIEAHRQQAAENPRKRGPKRKGVTPSAEHHDGAEAS
jgi:hypothetical protein